MRDRGSLHQVLNLPKGRKMEVKRVFLIVLDSFGIGELPDAVLFGDEGSSTLGSVSSSPFFNAPNLTRLGLFNIDGISDRRAETSPVGAYGRAAEMSSGKDTVTGHWEIGGIISEKPMPTYPSGFPKELLERIEKETGIGTLCNLPYSGTDAIRDYGKEQLETGKMIVYTSADSVFQAAAHNDVIPLEKLYEYCERVRKITVGDFSVGRVIARPFVGEYPDYTRTSDRHDYALPPPEKTMLDILSDAGYETLAVGKISDIFAGRGVSERITTTSNSDGMKKTEELLDRDFKGLCFVNLVDFDSAYGHRNDIDGYARAISEFDVWLGGFMSRLRDDDLLIVTADHGCDPKTESTDHSREYVPILAYKKGIVPENIGTRESFADIGKTVLSLFGTDGSIYGVSFADKIKTEVKKLLISEAKEAMKHSFSKYSGFKVGAALMTKSGKIYRGCNIESAAFSPSICAERTALVKAMSEGEREFSAIAVVGGRGGDITEICPPCGVCRQFLFEHCGGELDVYLSDGVNSFSHKLSELLPLGFSDKNI